MADLVVKSVLKNNAREKSCVNFGGVRILMNSTVYFQNLNFGIPENEIPKIKIGTRGLTYFPPLYLESS